MSGGSADHDDALARRVARAMYARDRAAHALGIKIVDVRAGFARVSFVVREDMLNGHDVCHGGFIFTLADAAFAYACNSRNATNVALQCSISFAAPGRAGETLEAVATERVLGGRTGTYDVEVQRPGGPPIAYFRGTSYRLGAAVVDASVVT